MALSVNLLTSVADCDAVLAELNRDRETLRFNRLRFERSKETATDRSTGLDTDIAATQAEQASLIAVIATLPDGPIKTEMTVRKTVVDFRLFQLNQRKLNAGTTAVILLESQINETDQRLAALDADITEVEARKNTLPA
jgi:chromosome segregation ATPase